MNTSAVSVSPQRLHALRTQGKELELFFTATALIGAGLILAGTTRWCGMARLVALMPWNRKINCVGHASAQ